MYSYLFVTPGSDISSHQSNADQGEKNKDFHCDSIACWTWIENFHEQILFYKHRWLRLLIGFQSTLF